MGRNKNRIEIRNLKKKNRNININKESGRDQALLALSGKGKEGRIREGRRDVSRNVRVLVVLYRYYS